MNTTTELTACLNSWHGMGVLHIAKVLGISCTASWLDNDWHHSGQIDIILAVCLLFMVGQKYYSTNEPSNVTFTPTTRSPCIVLRTSH